MQREGLQLPHDAAKLASFLALLSLSESEGERTADSDWHVRRG